MSKRSSKYLSGPFLIFASIVLVIGGLVWLGSTKEEKAVDTSSGMLSVSESSWNIGAVSMKDGIHTKEIELTNDSNEPVTITKMETSCMCTTATVIHEDGTKGPTKGMVGHGGTPYLSETIAPGEKARLAVAYDPNAHGPNATGPISRNISIRTDSSEQPTINLKFSGVVVK